MSGSQKPYHSALPSLSIKDLQRFALSLQILFIQNRNIPIITKKKTEDVVIFH